MLVNDPGTIRITPVVRMIQIEMDASIRHLVGAACMDQIGSEENGIAWLQSDSLTLASLLVVALDNQMRTGPEIKHCIGLDGQEEEQRHLFR